MQVKSGIKFQKLVYVDILHHTEPFQEDVSLAMLLTHGHQHCINVCSQRLSANRIMFTKQTHNLAFVQGICRSTMANSVNLATCLCTGTMLTENACIAHRTNISTQCSENASSVLNLDLYFSITSVKHVHRDHNTTSQLSDVRQSLV